MDSHEQPQTTPNPYEGTVRLNDIVQAHVDPRGDVAKISAAALTVLARSRRALFKSEIAEPLEVFHPALSAANLIAALAALKTAKLIRSAYVWNSGDPRTRYWIRPRGKLAAGFPVSSLLALADELLARVGL